MSSDAEKGKAAAGGENNSSEHVVIYMARPPFRAVNQDLFTPLSVPIGPYHRASCSDRWKQEKQRVAVETKEVLKDKGSQLMQVVKELEGVVRKCYGGLLYMKQEELASMLLNDGCYVLKFFTQYGGHSDVSPPRGEDNTVMRDIIYLLENQLPMIVLERIHQCLVPESSVPESSVHESSVPESSVHESSVPESSVPERSVVDVVEKTIRGLLKEQKYIRGENKPQHVQAPPCHLLQLVHSYFTIQQNSATGAQSKPQETGQQNNATGAQSKPQETGQQNSATGAQSKPQETGQQNNATGSGVQEGPEVTHNTQRKRVGRWRRATEYSRYGNVQLKPRKFEHGVESILDVHFDGSTLWIPHLLIDSSTWTILRNLMALEEQTGTGGSPVTAYCLFMSQLASKVEDIELLRRKRIVEHFWGNDEEVAQGFADLCKKVVLDVDDVHSNYLRDKLHLLNERCESLGHNCWGSFRHKHCGDSMRILAFVTAGLLFAFQLTQVILTGFSLRKVKGN